jgi:mediator of RNA polymerase II transcription subunit 14
VLKGFERQEVDTKTESMPGVIMENGSRNGSHTNHDRDQRPNGVNGVDYGSEKLQEKGKGRAEPLQNMTPTSPTIPNGLVTFKEGPHQNGGGSLNSPNMQERVNQLPPEIVHITENYQSLQSLLSRLAQKTHNDLTAKILELAQMPVPASAVNGNASHITTVDDNSLENNSKKKRLLDFLENAHADWAKALIITIWSRRADGVSKIVDLKEHIKTQSGLYGKVILDLAHMKIGLIQARLPNPDLKTALEVLTTGKASWMPEVCSFSMF